MPDRTLALRVVSSPRPGVTISTHWVEVLLSDEAIAELRHATWSTTDAAVKARIFDQYLAPAFARLLA
jgi:hypothetical protein